MQSLSFLYPPTADLAPADDNSPDHRQFASIFEYLAEEAQPHIESKIGFL